MGHLASHNMGLWNCMWCEGHQCLFNNYNAWSMRLDLRAEKLAKRWGMAFGVCEECGIKPASLGKTEGVSVG